MTNWKPKPGSRAYCEHEGMGTILRVGQFSIDIRVDSDGEIVSAGIGQVRAPKEEE